ncbi:neutral zinc metallopeptidase [Phenylobacterium sp.]|uniref:neutral zinc metallopeptidase n=1 Tax=Phenylobacterium sp. TaxID=1871053 RepID=UPI00286DD59D|nr:neutral zinc metallopeptidase [Phenylobacterium sp.]
MAACAATQALAVTPGEDVNLRRRVLAVVESTSREWDAAFRAQGGAYDAPRVLMLRSPIGHPARGAGYSLGLVVIDLNDIAALEAVFAQDSALAALVIAHEVGHHVQALTDGPANRGEDPEILELRADCYAGWWLGRAHARSPVDYPIPNLQRRLPEMLGLLSVLQAGHLLAASEAEIHGAIPQRLEAVRQGMAADDPKVCVHPPGRT